ncbi:MAG: ornithine carbamoyltransferase [Christensenellales bacterium]|jgi:ornithine carbamoyltransferase
MDLFNYAPKTKFGQKHLLTLQDYSKEELLTVLSTALKLKSDVKRGIRLPLLFGKILAMIFTKPSTRTRVSFEAGIYQLGGTGMFLSGNDIQLGRGEPIEDTAKVLGRMVDGIMIRTFKQSDVEALASHSGVPVINGLTDECHPCQALADLLTYYEHFGDFSGKLAFVGDGNNVCASLLVICTKLGMDISVACPKGFEPEEKYLNFALENAKQSGSKVVITIEPEEAVQGAKCVYTDVWASMGQEGEAQKRIAAFAGKYCVTEQLCALADENFIFQHCLPAHRGEEVLPEVIDGPHSVVFDEAENRLHVQKAVMALLMGKPS